MQPTSTSATEKALAVVAFDAILLAACVTSQAPSFTFALIVAITPALLAGTLLGWLAGTLRRGRFAILATTALATLAVTALLAGSAPLALYGCLPLLASMSLLERWTRPRARQAKWSASYMTS